jgi:hypothetical protein
MGEDPQGLASAVPRLAEQPGTVIGRYKLLEKIGEGGMGVVYMAEQQEPVRRKVALKVIKLSLACSENRNGIRSLKRKGTICQLQTNLISLKAGFLAMPAGAASRKAWETPSAGNWKPQSIGAGATV